MRAPSSTAWPTKCLISQEEMWGNLRYQMGSEWTPAVSKNGTSCSLGGGGLDAGIGLQWGKSELVGLKWLKCDECSPVETPF
ncbi:hypothetical protein BRN90_02580 [Xanthomonas oryzae pv. oryzae]|nr:hypothetical protein BRN90_02580 [Xanthomonas oryzae pv. oryzae]